MSVKAWLIIAGIVAFFVIFPRDSWHAVSSIINGLRTALHESGLH